MANYWGKFYGDRTRKKPLLRRLKNIGMASKKLYRNTLNQCSSIFSEASWLDWLNWIGYHHHHLHHHHQQHHQQQQPLTMATSSLSYHRDSSL